MTEKKKASGIKSWPEDDRPREKLLKKGAGLNPMLSMRKKSGNSMAANLLSGQSMSIQRGQRVISVDSWQERLIIESFIRFRTVSQPQGRRFSF